MLSTKRISPGSLKSGIRPRSHSMMSCSVTEEPGGPHDQCAEAVAVKVVLVRHDSDIAHRGVLAYRFLDLFRVDVFAADDDHVIRATADEEPTRRVQLAEVARIDIAIGTGAGARGELAGHRDPAGLAGWPPRVVRAADLNGDAADRPARPFPDVLHQGPGRATQPASVDPYSE